MISHISVLPLGCAAAWPRLERDMIASDHAGSKVVTWTKVHEICFIRASDVAPCCRKGVVRGWRRLHS